MARERDAATKDQGVSSDALARMAIRNAQLKARHLTIISFS
ncbi:unnamed protein product [Sphacelaria rigidula]